MVAVPLRASHWLDRVRRLKLLLRAPAAERTTTHIPAGELRRGDRFEFGGNLLLVALVVNDDPLVKVFSECAGQPFEVTFLEFEAVVVTVPRPPRIV